MSYIVCHVSYVVYGIPYAVSKISYIVYSTSFAIYYTCHMSYVICHMSYVVCRTTGNTPSHDPGSKVSDPRDNNESYTGRTSGTLTINVRQ